MQQPTETNAPHVPKIEAICVGDAREMDFTQGQCLKTKIHRGLSILAELEAFRLQKPKWMPLRVFRTMAEFKARRVLTDALAVDLPDTQARLLALAEDAEVRPRNLFLLNAMEAVMSDISRSSVVPIAAGCSAVAVTGRSSTGDPILAHNFDYLPAVQPLYTVRESRPKGKLRCLEFIVAPLCGAVDGINEAGLSITNNYAYATDGTQLAPTLSMLVTEALSRCHTVPQAAEFLAKSKRWDGGILMLGDSDGRIASLELSSTRSSLRHPAKNEDRLFHTNRYQQEQMTQIEIHDSALYSQRAPRALRDKRVHQSSDVRDERLQVRLATVGRLEPNRLLELMSDHGPDDAPSANTICMHSDYWYTTACLQLCPKQRQMRIAYDTACRARFVDFEL